MLVLEFNELHAETGVGLVATVVFHGVSPSHTGQGGDVNAENGLEEVAAHALKHLENIFLLHEGHLAVYLRELGLAVGAQVFIAEALADLEVAVNTCYHTELL